MAKAITHINKRVPNKQEEQQQALTEILATLADNKEALTKTLDILTHFHGLGALDAIQALLEKLNEVGVIALQQINQPSMHNTIKIAFNTVKFIGTMNPGQLQTMLDGVGIGLERASESIKNGESHGVMKLAGMMRNPEVRASMTTMIEFLRGMGEAFTQDKKPQH
ncbi:DUF1641 domain-containing protein [Peribacillus sp. SCS-155]|uniref:DUF1641 domain-containing protein n=1 Tax=Peribacillus sedimenti TaxID=3115297 RepID=UPI003906311A